MVVNKWGRGTRGMYVIYEGYYDGQNRPNVIDVYRFSDYGGCSIYIYIYMSTAKPGEFVNG